MSKYTWMLVHIVLSNVRPGMIRCAKMQGNGVVVLIDILTVAVGDRYTMFAPRRILGHLNHI